MLIRHQAQGTWRAPATTAYTNEAELRDLLAQTPSLLPGVGKGPAAATTEMPIPGAGAADVVIVEAGGEITVVECKLRANPQIRREVVGQAFAYASAMWEMTYQDLDRAFQRSDRKVSLAEAFMADDEDWDEEAFREAVAHNLAEGRMRLVIAVDEITSELKRVVTYLNRHTTRDVELLAIELHRAVDENVEVLLPATYGEESAGPGPRAIDTAGVIEAIRTAYRGRGADSTRAAERMIELLLFMEEQGAKMSYGKRSTPSVSAWLGLESGNPISITFLPYAFSVNFAFMRYERSEPELERVAGLLREIPNVEKYYRGLAKAGFKKSPRLSPHDVLTSDEILEDFKRVILEATRPPG